jgi:hypothetical protein
VTAILHALIVIVGIGFLIGFNPFLVLIFFGAWIFIQLQQNAFARSEERRIAEWYRQHPEADASPE